MCFFSKKKTKKRKKKKQKKSDEVKKIQFSKIWLTIIISCSIIWISCSYILAFLGKVDIAQELSNGIVTVVVSVFIGYFLKSFFETREEEKVKLQYKEMEMMHYSDNEIDDCGDPDAYTEIDENP